VKEENRPTKTFSTPVPRSHAAPGCSFRASLLPRENPSHGHTKGPANASNFRSAKPALTIQAATERGCRNPSAASDFALAHSPSFNFDEQSQACHVESFSRPKEISE
jgi:hypothetical protein